MKNSLAAFLFVGVALLLFSCAGGRHYQSIPAEGPASVPRYLELRSEVSAATMHFPAGTYSLSASDASGFYYQSSRPIAEHLGAMPIRHEGGIYVNKRDPRRLRGYVVWGGKITHVGNFSHAKHELHD